MTQLLTMYCGLFFLSQSDVDPDSIAFDPSRDFVLTPVTQMSLLVLIVALNAFFFVTWLVKFVQTLRGAIKD